MTRRPPRSTLFLHDALPISWAWCETWQLRRREGQRAQALVDRRHRRNDREPRRRGSQSFLDRKSTRLNSSHITISYAVFCLKKKTLPHYLHTTTLSQNANTQ